MIAIPIFMEPTDFKTIIFKCSLKNMTRMQIFTPLLLTHYFTLLEALKTHSFYKLANFIIHNTRIRIQVRSSNFGEIVLINSKRIKDVTIVNSLCPSCLKRAAYWSRDTMNKTQTSLKAIRLPLICPFEFSFEDTISDLPIYSEGQCRIHTWTVSQAFYTNYGARD